MKAPCHEAIAVGVDQIAGHVFAQGHAGWTRQRESHRSRAPERDLGCAEYGAHFEAVTRQEPFRGQHTEGVDIVVALGLTPAPTGRALQPFDQRIAAAE